MNFLLSLFTNVAHAAADPAVASTTEVMGEAIQENFLSGLSTILPYVMVLFGLMIVITLGMRLTKRAAK